MRSPYATNAHHVKPGDWVFSHSEFHTTRRLSGIVYAIEPHEPFLKRRYANGLDTIRYVIPGRGVSQTNRRMITVIPAELANRTTIMSTDEILRYIEWRAEHDRCAARISVILADPAVRKNPHEYASLLKRQQDAHTAMLELITGGTK